MKIERDDTFRVVAETDAIRVEEKWGPVTDCTESGEKYPSGWYTGQEFRITPKAKE